MKKLSFVTPGAILICIFVLIPAYPGISRPALAAPGDQVVPVVVAIDPASALNDLETSVTITGTDFTAEVVDTQVTAAPTVFLGSTALKNVTWVDAATLTATVPWGMDPGTYLLSVVNPDGGTGSLTDAFIITQGIGQWKGGELFGGDVQQILMKPDDSSTLYALAFQVGIFRSQDGGENWKFINPSISDAGITVDPLHPSWIYSYAADGLYRSPDEGNTWIKTFSKWPDGRSVARGQVYPSPHNNQVLFISALLDPYIPPTGALGLIKSTDGGTTWNIVADMEGIAVQDVDFHPTDPLKMILGTQTGQVYQSTDGGETWSEVTKPPISKLGMITYNPDRGDEVWVTLAGDAGIYKSTDAAFSEWHDVTPKDGSRNTHEVKFTGADLVYTIGHHSDDGGKTWQPFAPGISYDEMCFDPNNSQIGYVGEGIYGLQKTINGGQTWEIKNQGLTGLTAYIIDASNANPLRVYAAFVSWPGIYRSDDGAKNWVFIPIPGSYNVWVVHEDPFNSQRIYVAADSGFYVSIDGGTSWSDLGWSTPLPRESGTFNVMVPDPYQSGHLLVGLRNALSKGWLYESTDYGVTWHPIVLPQKDLACIQDIAFHPETQGLVYLATCGTGVYRSTDSGNTWKRIDDPQQPDMQNGWKIAIATHPEPMVLVGTNQYPYVSKDGGETWESTQNSPGAFAFMFLNEDSTRLYATTWRGLVLSRDGGNSWEQAAGAIGKVRTTAMDYTKTENYTILYAATSGGDPGATSSTVMQNPQRAGITENNLVDAGIYRYVQRTWKVFLPALRKGK